MPEPGSTIAAPSASARASAALIGIHLAVLDFRVQPRPPQRLHCLRRASRLTYLFVTHDLAAVRAVATRVSVFREGRLMAKDSIQRIFSASGGADARWLFGAVPLATGEETRSREGIRAAAETGEATTS